MGVAYDTLVPLFAREESVHVVSSGHSVDDAGPILEQGHTQPLTLEPHPPHPCLVGSTASLLTLAPLTAMSSSVLMSTHVTCSNGIVVYIVWVMWRW